MIEVSSLRSGVKVAVRRAISGHAERWREEVEACAETLATFTDGSPAHVVKDTPLALGSLMALLCRNAGLSTIELPVEARLRRRGDLTFTFNYGERPGWRLWAANR